MDLQKYEEALDNISETIIPKYYNDKKAKYNKGKKKMLKKFEINHYEDMFDSLPYFLPYFRKNFLFFCQYEPDFVGSISYSISTISISEIRYNLKTTVQKFYFTNLEENLIIAENSYEVLHKEIKIILDSPKILKRNIHEILNLIEPLTDVIYYSSGRQIFTQLLKELQFSLQILYNIENLGGMIPPDRIVIEGYSNLLIGLGDLKKREYSKYTFIQILIEDLENIYKRIEGFHSKPKIQDKVSDSGSVTTKPTNVDKAVGLLCHLQGLTWDEITITLISLESIRITARDFKQTYHFSELDMKDGRSSEKADNNWVLLSLFAKKNGTVTYTDIDSTGRYSSPKKAVATLQNKLKKLIGLKDNPIEKYKTRVGYIAKFYIKNEIPFQFHGSAQQIEKINELKGE